MKAALANIRLHFLGLSETEYHLSSSNKTKSSISLLSVFRLHKDNELLPLLQHALRFGLMGKPSFRLRRRRRRKRGEEEVSCSTCSVTAWLVCQPTNQPTSLQSIPVVVLPVCCRVSSILPIPAVQLGMTNS